MNNYYSVIFKEKWVFNDSSGLNCTAYEERKLRI